MDQDMRALADLVKRTRKALHLGQEEVAKQAGVSLNTLGNFERGNSVPQPDKLRAILRVLGLEKDAGDSRADQTWEEFSPKVRTFLFVIGLFLNAQDEDRQDEIIRSVTRQIVQ